MRNDYATEMNTMLAMSPYSSGLSPNPRYVNPDMINILKQIMASNPSAYQQAMPMMAANPMSERFRVINESINEPVAPAMVPQQQAAPSGRRPSYEEDKARIDRLMAPQKAPTVPKKVYKPEEVETYIVTLPNGAGESLRWRTKRGVTPKMDWDFDPTE